MKKITKIILITFFITASLIFAKEASGMTVCEGRSMNIIGFQAQTFTCNPARSEKFCAPDEVAGGSTVFYNNPIFPCYKSGNVKCTCNYPGWSTANKNTYTCWGAYKKDAGRGQLVLKEEHFTPGGIPAVACKENEEICYGTSVGNYPLPPWPCMNASGELPPDQGPLPFDINRCDGKTALSIAELLQCPPEKLDLYYRYRIFKSISMGVKDRAIEIAKSQLGTKYVLGTHQFCRTGGITVYADCPPNTPQKPQTNDCSQLTGWAYYWATREFTEKGLLPSPTNLVSLTTDQVNQCTPIDLNGKRSPENRRSPEDTSGMEPGDLIFFESCETKDSQSSSGNHHVGLYLGGGEFIHAPQTGDVVKKGSLSARSGTMCPCRLNF